MVYDFLIELYWLSFKFVSNFLLSHSFLALKHLILILKRAFLEGCMKLSQNVYWTYIPGHPTGS